VILGRNEDIVPVPVLEIEVSTVHALPRARFTVSINLRRPKPTDGSRKIFFPAVGDRDFDPSRLIRIPELRPDLF